MGTLANKKPKKTAWCGEPINTALYSLRMVSSLSVLHLHVIVTSNSNIVILLRTSVQYTVYTIYSIYCTSSDRN